MKSNIKYLKNMVLALMAFMLVFAVPAFGEEQESDLYYNDKVQDLMIIIGYESDDFTAYFVDPNDKKYTLDALGAEMEDGLCIAVIEDAVEGRWKMVYDKGSNESLHVTVEPWLEGISIENFKMSGPTDGYVKLKFSIDGPKSCYYNYRVVLGTSADFAKQRVLEESDFYYSGDEKELSIDFRDVNSSDSYYLLLEVSYSGKIMDYFDEEIVGPFSVKGEELEKLSDYDVIVNTAQHQIVISLEDDLPYYAATGYVTVDINGARVAESLLDFDGNQTQTMVEYDPETAGEVVCNVKITNGDGRISADSVKTFRLDDQGDKFTCVMPEDKPYNNRTYQIYYKNADDNRIYWVIEDGYEDYENVTGSGYLKLELNEGTTYLKVRYTNDDGIEFVDERYVTVDSLPPALRLYEHPDGLITEASTYILSGVTDAGAAVTINDEAITTSGDGAFQKELTLEEGENVFVITAQDEAGNASTYAVKINKTVPAKTRQEGAADSSFLTKILPYLPLIIAGYASIFGIILLLIVAGGKKKGKPVLSIIRNASIVGAVFALIAFVADFIVWKKREAYAKSVDFINMAYDSKKEAYAYMETTDKLHTVWQALLIAFIALAVIAVLAAVLGILLKPNPEAKARRQAAREAKKAEREAKLREAEEAKKRAAEAKAAEDARKAEEAKKAAEAKAIEDSKKAAEVKTEPEVKSEPEPEVEAKPEPKPEPKKPETKPKKLRFCTGCGNQLAEGMAYCNKCGKKV